MKFRSPTRRTRRSVYPGLPGRCRPLVDCSHPCRRGRRPSTSRNCRPPRSRMLTLRRRPRLFPTRQARPSRRRGSRQLRRCRSPGFTPAPEVQIPGFTPAPAASIPGLTLPPAAPVIPLPEFHDLPSLPGAESAIPASRTFVPDEFTLAARARVDAKLLTALEAVVSEGASDLHISIGSPPLLRVDGSLRALPGQPVWRPRACRCWAVQPPDRRTAGKVR